MTQLLAVLLIITNCLWYTAFTSYRKGVLKGLEKLKEQTNGQL